MKKYCVLVFLLTAVPVMALQDTLSIPEIQGYGSTSPYVDDTITTHGIVTAVVPPYNGGYYLQDATADTFAGIFIYTGTYSYPQVRVGDSVEVQGIVDEYYDLTQLGYVQYDTILGTTDPPTPLLLATGDVSGEKYEAMLVAVASAECTNDDLGYGEWEVDDGSGPAVVDDAIYSFDPQLGGYYNVTGALNYSYSAFKIEPRDYRDVSGPGGSPSDKTIYDVQYTTEPSGASPLVDSLVRVHGLVTYIVNAGFYLEDIDGGQWNGIYVYTDISPRDLNRGDSCSVVGHVSEYDGFTEIGNSPVFNVISSGNTLPAPFDITTATVGEAEEGVLVHLNSARCIEDSLPPSGYYYGMSDNNGVDTLLTSDLYGDYDYIIGDFYELIGVIKTDTFNFVLEPRDSVDITHLAGISIEDGNDKQMSVKYDDEKIEIRLSIREQSKINISVYDISGRMLSEIHKGNVNKGSHTFEFNPLGLPSGLYFINVKSGKINRSYKFVVL